MPFPLSLKGDETGQARADEMRRVVRGHARQMSERVGSAAEPRSHVSDTRDAFTVAIVRMLRRRTGPFQQ